ncbi:MAG TPA: glycosyltransferase family 2 protein [Vicinamibacterales bacterium]|nr:glycosyltransferase family 2 protein [Vicinamibacterales bacterium]
MNDITGLILTRDEAPNIGRTLERLQWLPSIVVVDSESADATRDIAAGFPNVRVVTRRFTTHAEQWNFGLEQAGIQSEWVLALDADFIVSDALAAEIKALRPDAATAGYWASFEYCIDGRPLRGAAYPPVAVLYRRQRGRYEQDGHTQRIRLNGAVGTLAARIYHDDRKPLAHWLASQSRYMALEAEKLSRPGASVGLVDQVRKLIVIAPPAMFVYCYIVRGGILDGTAGLFYAMQRAVAEGILSLYLVRRMLGRE